jgi:phage terminase large subunit GpA-like protein
MLHELYKDNVLKIQDSIYDFDPVRLEPSEWVEKNIFLTSAESRYAGFFSYDRSPYSKEIIDNLSPSSDVEISAVMKCSQSGFTAGVVVPMIPYIISQCPANTLFFSGSEKLVRDTVRDRLDPIIQNSGMKDYIRPNSIKKANQRTGDTDFKKEFSGGSLTCSTYKPSSLRFYSAKFILADEFDDAPRTDKKEGSIRSLVEARAKSYGDTKKIVYISSPTTKGVSNIEEVYNDGDKRQWNWECPHCKTYIPILWKVERDNGTFGGIKWELDQDNVLIEKSVHYECQNCGGRIDYKQKYDLNLTGKWIPTAKPKQPQYRSYSFNALCNPPGFNSWVSLVHEFLKACPPNEPVDIGLLKTFTNVQLGELWEDRGKSPRAISLMNNIRNYEIGVVPDQTCERDDNGKIALISLACDLGGIMDYDNRIEDVRLDWEIIAHTSCGQTYSIKHGSIGTFKRTQNKTKKDMDKDSDRVRFTYTHGVKNSVWDILKDIIYTPLQGQSGMYYDIDITVIDTGHFTKLANNFISSIKDRKVFGVKGLGEDNYRKLGKNSPMITHSRENKGLLYLLDVNLIKDTIANNMALQMGLDGSQPDGYMNFPQPAEGKYNLNSYFSHYEAEHRVPVTKNDVEIGYAWKKKRENNHFFDVAVYNLAAREIFISDLKLYDSRNKDITWLHYCDAINM